MAGLAELLHTSKHSDLFSSKFTAPQPVAPSVILPPTEVPSEPTVSEDDRTVFVGNVPLDVNKHDIAAEFGKYGTVEKYKEDGVCCNYYVLYPDKSTAEKALAANGSLFHGNHLRVDLAAAAKTHDPSLSVFVGNLPFTVTEEELWTEFTEFGTIGYVRVIRDKQTHTGKGFAYVCFASKQSARMALSKHNATFQVIPTQGRPLRVFPCKKQVELNVQRRVKGRDAQGEKLRWKRQPQRPTVPPEPEFEPYTEAYPGEDQGEEESMPPNLFPKKKRKRDEGPEPAWKEMKREQKKLKTLKKATKQAERAGKAGKPGKKPKH